jgi:hypothetical protein
MGVGIFLTPKKTLNMAQERKTPSQLIEAYMVENKLPLDSKLLSYILVVDMYFRTEIENAYRFAQISVGTDLTASKYYFMKYTDND